MNKLFAELEARHEGFSVVDIRLLANPSEANGRSAAELDGEFATAVRESVEIDLKTLAQGAPERHAALIGRWMADASVQQIVRQGGRAHFVSGAG